MRKSLHFVLCNRYSGLHIFRYHNCFNLAFVGRVRREVGWYDPIDDQLRLHGEDAIRWGCKEGRRCSGLLAMFAHCIQKIYHTSMVYTVKYII